MPSSNENGLAEAEHRIAVAKRTGETVLKLSGLDLEVLPESACQLAHLQFLYINDNRLTELPESIGRLVELQKLSLLGNGLTKLPECIERLVQLVSLRLSHNGLTQVPQWIGQLTQLNRLYLNSNQLTRLPESIGQLVQLEELHLHRNQLTQLPESVLQLTQLRRLYLHGNEALNIPAEELGPARQEVREEKGSPKSPREILDYYFAQLKRAAESGEQPLNEAKVLVLGEAEGGEVLAHPCADGRVASARFQQDARDRAERMDGDRHG